MESRFPKSGLRYLDNDHNLHKRVKDLTGESDLRFHLVVWHNVSTKNCHSHGDAAKLHLVMHAIEAKPELEELIFNYKREEKNDRT